MFAKTSDAPFALTVERTSGDHAGSVGRPKVAGQPRLLTHAPPERCGTPLLTLVSFGGLDDQTGQYVQSHAEPYAQADGDKRHLASRATSPPIGDGPTPRATTRRAQNGWSPKKGTDDRRQSGTERSAGRARPAMVHGGSDETEQTVVRGAFDHVNVGRRGRDRESAASGGQKTAFAGRRERADHVARQLDRIDPRHAAEADVGRLLAAGQEGGEIVGHLPGLGLVKKPVPGNEDVLAPSNGTGRTCRL